MASHALLKRINRARILNAIRQHSPLARTELARQVSLDKKSITNLLEDLLAKHMVVEVGTTQAHRGRPRTLLSFDTERHGVLGLAVSYASAMGAIVDLHGKIQAFSEVEYPLDSPRPRVLSAIRRVYERLKAIGPRRIDGVGIGAPGVIDLDSGLVERSVNIPALKGLNLLEAAREFITEPVYLEESSRAKALAEKWFGLGATEQSFVCVSLEVGVGAGIVHEGRLYSNGMAALGEIGHVRVEKDGRACRCGNRGCLEAYISQRVLLDEIEEASGKRFKSLDDVDMVTPAIRQVLNSAGYRLGVALSYVVNIISPPLIILNGHLMRFKDDIMPEVERGARECSAPACFERTRIVPSNLQSSSVLGAAARALSEIFEVKGHFYV